MGPYLEIPNQHKYAHQHHHGAESLGHPYGLAEKLPVEQVQAVRAQALHPEAAQAVPQEVKPGVLPVKLPVLRHHKQQQKQTYEVPKALVEKGGMHLNEGAHFSGELHAEHGGGLCAEGLSVHKVAPPAHDLPHQQAHNHQVCHGEELKAPLSLAPGKAQSQNDHGDDRAVNGQAPVPKGDGAAEVKGAVSPFEIIQVKQHIVDPRPDDAHGNAPEQAVIEVILADAVLFALLHSQQHGQQQTRGNEDAVPVDPVADVNGLGAGGKGPVAEKSREADGAVGHDKGIHIHTITPSDKPQIGPCAPGSGSGG